MYTRFHRNPTETGASMKLNRGPVTIPPTVLVLAATLIHLLMPISAVGQTIFGKLSVTSSPSGLTAWVDDVPIGPTPLEDYPILPGQHTVRVARPAGSPWDVLDWREEVVISDSGRLKVHAEFVGPVVILSSPFEAEVLLNNVSAGKTPLRFPNLKPGPYTVSVAKPGYEHVSRGFVVRDTSHQVISITMIPLDDTWTESGSIPPVRAEKSRLGRRLGFATLGLGLMFAGLAIDSDRKADDAYTGYLRTGDPARSEALYQRAASQDRRTSTFAVAAQVNFLGSFYFFLSRAFRADD